MFRRLNKSQELIEADQRKGTFPIQTIPSVMNGRTTKSDCFARLFYILHLFPELLVLSITVLPRVKYDEYLFINSLVFSTTASKYCIFFK